MSDPVRSCPVLFRGSLLLLLLVVAVLYILPTVLHADVRLMVNALDSDGMPAGYALYDGVREIAREVLDDQGNVRSRAGLVPDGPARAYDVSDNVRAEIRYRHNARNGRLYEYNEEGILVRSVPYVRDKLQGTAYLYYEDGVTRSISNHVNGSPHGLFSTFYESGVTESVTNYVYGKEHGIAFSYFGGGEVRSVEPYESGYLTGLSVRYQAHLDGITTASVRTFVRGVTEGACIEYHDTGTVMSSSGYRNGLLEGQKFTWYPSGVTRSEEYFLKGVRSGTVRTFYPNAVLSFIGTFADGRPEGEHREYYGTGILKTDVQYVSGNIHGRARTYHENGLLAEDGNYEDGLRNGAFKTWGPSGHLLAEITYCKGGLQGTSLFYAQDGTVRERIEYMDGVRVEGPGAVTGVPNAAALEAYLARRYDQLVVGTDNVRCVPFERIECVPGEVRFHISLDLQQAIEQQRVSVSDVRALLATVNRDARILFSYEMAPDIVLISGREREVLREE